MKTIKFRGRVIDSDKRDGGRIVFGSLVDHGESKHCPRYWIYPLEGDRNFPVDPDSVAQLVGYDANGNEVYEGDTVLRYDSEEEFIEAPENGVLREVVLYTQVNPDLEAYYCLVKEIHQ